MNILLIPELVWMFCWGDMAFWYFKTIISKQKFNNEWMNECYFLLVYFFQFFVFPHNGKIRFSLTPAVSSSLRRKNSKVQCDYGVLKHEIPKDFLFVSTQLWLLRSSLFGRNLWTIQTLLPHNLLYPLP